MAGKPKRGVLYIPDRGDLVWLNFDPQSGHEQAGRRPALVLTPKKYNGKVGLAVVCPITSKVKGYTFEVEIFSPSVEGVALADQIKSLDYVSRKIKFIAKCHPMALAEVIEVAREFLDWK